MASEALESVLGHLEFLGYEIIRDEKLSKARHPVKYNLLIKDYNGMLLFTSIIGASQNAKMSRPGYLEFLNSLNRSSAVTRVYADQDADLIFEATFPQLYDRVAFAKFIDLWHQDTAQLSQRADEAAHYLK